MTEPNGETAPPFEVRNAHLAEIADRLDRIATVLEDLANTGKPVHPIF